MSEKRGAIRSVGATMHELMRSLGIDRKLREYDAVVQWEQVVGAQIARIARAERISQGLLVVHVTASAWRQELTLRKSEIIRKLNEALGGEVVKDIRFR